MTPHPIPPNEPQRIAALHECGVLATPPEPAFDDLTRLLAEGLGLPIALVSLIDRDRVWFKSRHGLEAEEANRELAFCGHALVVEDLLVVEDALSDPRFRDNPFVTGPPHLRFYAGAPLRSFDGHAYGVLCAIGLQPRRLSDEASKLLRGLARQAETQLDFRRRNHQYEREIERRRAVEAELVEARDLANAASRAKTDFLATMSHELRTPLNAIVGFAALLAADPDAEAADRQEWLSAMRHSADHLLGLIDEVLDVTRIESSEMRFDAVETEPVALVRQAVDTLQPQADVKHLQLRVEVEGHTPPQIWIDPTRVRQVVLNLVGNAIKFTPAGEVAVTVRHQTRQAPWLEIVVRDTGPGLAPEVADSVFDLFVQQDESASRSFGGIGLGLYLSRQICRRLGGDLTVESQEGRGSTFKATLFAPPTSPEAASPSEAMSDRGSEETTAVPETPRVLLVDDHDVNRKLFGLILRRSGFEVELAAGGGEAVDLVRYERPELPYHAVLMDLQMPEIDGLEAARRLRRQGFSRPIIAFTADATVDARGAALEAGCDAYLTKPIQPQALAEAVRTAIAHGPSLPRAA